MCILWIEIVHWCARGEFSQKISEAALCMMLKWSRRCAQWTSNCFFFSFFQFLFRKTKIWTPRGTGSASLLSHLASLSVSDGMTHDAVSRNHIVCSDAKWRFVYFHTREFIQDWNDCLNGFWKNFQMVSSYTALCANRQILSQLQSSFDACSWFKYA